MKIEIPDSVKEVLRCVECNELLSCGPVFLVHETSAAICGRCSQQPPGEEEEEPSTSTTKRSRNLQYEAAAKLLSFPCSFSDQGCLKQMDFSEEEPNIHERDCQFRTFICPVVSRGSCEWVGSRQKLSEHCRDVHPRHFLQNPSVLPPPDLTKSNLSNYLVSAFHFLFLVHVKVCVTSGKLFHSVRMFGDPEFLDKFSYLLKIEGNGLKVEKEGSVLRPGILMLQEPSASCVLINSLLDFLDGKYNEAKFTITIQTSIKFCLNCLKNIVYVMNLTFCEECKEKFKKCEFHTKGCLFVDVNKKKCWKHEEYFCGYQTKCFYCKVNFVGVGGSFIEHIGSSISCRKTIISNNDSIIRVTNTSKNSFILLSSNNIGTIICQYWISNSNFELNVCTSFPSHELKNFKCSIKLTDPQTKYTQILTPQIQYNNWWDWFIKEKTDNFSSWENIGIDIEINIDKI